MRVKFPKYTLKLHQLLEKLRKREPRFLVDCGKPPEPPLESNITVDSNGHLVKAGKKVVLQK